MKKTAYFSFLLLLAGGCSYGQSNEISFSAGAAFTPSQTLTTTFTPSAPCAVPICNVITNTMDTDTGFTLEASYERRIVKAGPAELYLELPFLATPKHDVATVIHNPLIGSIGGSISSSLFCLTPSARINFFPSGKISPWATVGGGWARLIQEGQNGNTGALQLGGGADFKTGVPHLGARVEVRDFWSGSFSNSSLQSSILGAVQITHVTPSAHHLFAGGGAVLRF